MRRVTVVLGTLLGAVRFDPGLYAQPVCHAPVVVRTVHGEDGTALIDGYRFRLEAVSDPATPGWVARLAVAADTGFVDDLIAIATPPYRSRNPRDLSLSYGWTAQAVVADRTRTLRFALDDAQHDQLAALVGVLLWPGTRPAVEVEEARRAWEAFPTGRLDLSIRDAVVGQVERDFRDVLTWIEVSVTLCPAR